jgi:hypothetical protein
MKKTAKTAKQGMNKNTNVFSKFLGNLNTTGKMPKLPTSKKGK